MFTNRIVQRSSIPSLRLVRYRHKVSVVTVNDKVTVQLLKNVKDIGIKGEVIRVKAAYMRNFLHHDNKAAYITKTEGPRIPVVEKPVVVAAPEIKKEETKKVLTPQKKSAEAMSLDELSKLFNTMRTRKARTTSQGEAITVSATEDESNITFSLSDLDELIPSTYTIKETNFPITKTRVSSLIFNLSGDKVPESSISFEKSTTSIDEIAETGDYNLIISSPIEKSSIIKTLKVQ
ncbi:hypothetical protein DFJ63DRAFT_314647 [Scheffersomyces coipomensis]|uniref:uncharacterized protein n=1 Tax=Scheffersomyces coipomensis TaxID=1788519 RepID=UPI00315CF384